MKASVGRGGMAKRRRGEGGGEDRGCKLPRPGGLGVPDSSQELVALHRARFVPWDPAAVVALAAAPDGTLLAAGRDTGDIELWETQAWSCLAVRAPPGVKALDCAGRFF